MRYGTKTEREKEREIDKTNCDCVSLRVRTGTFAEVKCQVCFICCAQQRGSRSGGKGAIEGKGMITGITQTLKSFLSLSLSLCFLIVFPLSFFVSVLCNSSLSLSFSLCFLPLLFFQCTET